MPESINHHNTSSSIWHTVVTSFLLVTMAVLSSSNLQSQKFEPVDLVSNPQYKISVSIAGEALGDIIIELHPKIAPKHVHNFDSLVALKFYDGTLFHRVIPGFMIQGGDPGTKTKSREFWGQADTTLRTVPAEFNSSKHVRGTISAARRGNDINSATSQFFICVDDLPNLDNNYSIFGSVLSGMEVVDKVVTQPRDEKDRPIEKVEMKIVRVK